MKNNFPEDVIFILSLSFNPILEKRKKYESHGRVCKTHFIEWLPLIKFAILAWFFSIYTCFITWPFLQTVTYVHKKKKQRKKDGNGYFSFCFCNRRLISHFFYVPVRNLLIISKKAKGNKDNARLDNFSVNSN